jgi:hypothetical protein
VTPSTLTATAFAVTMPSWRTPSTKTDEPGVTSDLAVTVLAATTSGRKAGHGVLHWFVTQ